MLFSLLVSLVFSVVLIPVDGVPSPCEGREHTCCMTQWALRELDPEDRAAFYKKACDELGALKHTLDKGPNEDYDTWEKAVVDPSFPGVEIACVPYCDQVDFVFPCRLYIKIEHSLNRTSPRSLEAMVDAANKMHCDPSLGITTEWVSAITYRLRVRKTDELVCELHKLLKTVREHRLNKTENRYRDDVRHDPSVFGRLRVHHRFPSILEDGEVQNLKTFDQINDEFVRIFGGGGLTITRDQYEFVTTQIRRAYVKDIEWRIRNLPHATSDETPEDYVEAAAWIDPNADLTVAQMYTKEVYGRTARKLLNELRVGEYGGQVAREVANKVRFFARWYNFTLEEIGTDEAELDRLSDESPFKGDTVYRWE